MRLEIRKCLVCSTAHVTKNVAELMDGNRINTFTDIECPGIVYSHFDYGWIVRWWPSKAERSRKEFAGEWKKYPACMKRVIEIAEKNGCNMIQFDNSGPLINGLKAYEW